MVRVQFWIYFVGKANRFVYGLTVDFKSELKLEQVEAWNCH